MFTTGIWTYVYPFPLASRIGRWTFSSSSSTTCWSAAEEFALLLGVADIGGSLRSSSEGLIGEVMGERSIGRAGHARSGETMTGAVEPLTGEYAMVRGLPGKVIQDNDGDEGQRTRTKGL